MHYAHTVSDKRAYCDSVIRKFCIAMVLQKVTDTMNRIKFEQILPNLSAMVKFIGGPWDGFKLRWSDGPCPEYVEVEDKKINAQQKHKYKLHVHTDNKNTTHVQYIYVEPIVKQE